MFLCLGRQSESFERARREGKPTPNRTDTAWVSATAQGHPFAAPCGVAPCFSCHAFCADPLAAHYFFN